MEEFLSVLKLQLIDRLEPGDLDEQIELYRNYINNEIAGGKTMDQVLARLGDPAKVADMIVEHEEGIRQQQENAKWSEMPKWNRDMTEEEVNAQIENPEHGIHAEFKEGEGWDVRLGKVKLNGWYGTLIILGIVVVIFILINQLILR